MFRYAAALVIAMGCACPCLAASWAEGMFKELSKDFGSVPHGPLLKYPFLVTNNTQTTVHISGIRVSCGCVSAMALTGTLKPGESTEILAQMDSSRFSGPKTVYIYISLDQPSMEEVSLFVRANSREDVTIAPETMALGHVRRGSRPVGKVNVTFLTGEQVRILRINAASNYVQPTLKEVTRNGGEVVYQISARLRGDTPVGKWFTDIYLSTNDPATPRLRVPLTVEIEPNLTISPATLDLGSIKLGSQNEGKVIVRGVQPFRIVQIRGTNNQVSVRDLTPDSKTMHILGVTLNPAKAGSLNQGLRVLTDLKDEGEISFQAKARIVP